MRRLLALLLSSLIVGCAAEAAPSAADEGATTGDDEAVAKGADTYVSLARDVRKCAFPACGGWFVTSLEDGELRCANGATARTCYVSTLDLGALEPARATIEGDAVIVAGRTATVKKLSRFVVSSAWKSDVAGAPKGTLYLVTEKKGTDLWALRLGVSRRRTIHALEGATFTPSSIYAGTIDSTSVLHATRAWLPIAAKATTACAAALDAQIGTAAKDLLWPSESDYPVTVFDRAGAGSVSTIEQFRTLVGATADQPIEQRDYATELDRLSVEQDWMDDGQKATAAKFRALRSVLETNLTDLRVYRVGTISITVYVVGKTSCGDLAGVTSTVIET